MSAAEELRAQIDRWIDAATTDAEKQERRRAAIETLHQERKQEAPTPIPRTILDVSRPGYRRAQREEKLGQEQTALRERARGSPFGAVVASAPPTKSKAQIADELRMIGRKREE